MHWLKRFVALTLLALWLPVTMHCALETLPAFSFLKWCCAEDEAPQPDHDCTQDFCSVIESGFYKIEDNPALSPDLTAGFALAVWDWITELPADVVPNVDPVSSVPPELARFWQFSYRAALPPRAPTFVA